LVFLKRNQNRTKTGSNWLFRFGYFGENTGSNRFIWFFPVWLGFFLIRVQFGFFGFKLIKLKPNRTDQFFQNSSWFFFTIWFFNYFLLFFQFNWFFDFFLILSYHCINIYQSRNINNETELADALASSNSIFLNKNFYFSCNYLYSSASFNFYLHNDYLKLWWYTMFFKIVFYLLIY
jgi:hypothetical protein